PLRVDFANPVVLLVGHVDVARGIRPQPPWAKEGGGRGRPQVAGESRRAGAREGRDATGGIHLHNDVPAGDVQVARGIYGYTGYAAAHRSKGPHRAPRRHFARAKIGSVGYV